MSWMNLMATDKHFPDFQLKKLFFFLLHFKVPKAWYWNKWYFTQDIQISSLLSSIHVLLCMSYSALCAFTANFQELVDITWCSDAVSRVNHPTISWGWMSLCYLSPLFYRRRLHWSTFYTLLTDKILGLRLFLKYHMFSTLMIQLLLRSITR